MRILITTPIWPPEIGGPATYIKELVARLPKTYQPTILAFADNPEIPEGPFQTVSKKNPAIIRQIIFIKKILGLGKNMDLIYAQNAMAAGVPSVIAAKLLKKPLILKFVGDNAWESAFRHGQTKKLLEDFLKKPDAGLKNKIRILIQKWVFKHANKIIVPSNYLGQVLYQYYQVPRGKIVTIYNAAESENNFSSEQIEPDPYQIITVGRLVPWKEIDGIIYAVNILRAEIPQIKLVIAGDGPERKHLEALCDSLQLKDRINFLGNVSKKETAWWRKKSAVFVLNSVYEGLPHTVLSSFAVSIPVIATNIPGTSEAVIDGKTGLAVTPHQPQALAQAIKKILTDHELGQRLAANARKFLEEKFSWPAHLQALSRLFEMTVSKPRH